MGNHLDIVPGLDAWSAVPPPLAACLYLCGSVFVGFTSGRGGLLVMSLVSASLSSRAGLSLPTRLPRVAACTSIFLSPFHLGVKSTAGRSIVPLGGQHAPLMKGWGRMGGPV